MTASRTHALVNIERVNQISSMEKLSSANARRRVPGYFSWVVLLGLLLPAASNPVSPGGQIIDDTSAYVDEKHVKLFIDFTIPVAYQWHFPKSPGREVMIAVLPVRTASPVPTNIREQIRIPAQLETILADAYLDGTEMRSLLLILHARHDIGVVVSQSGGAQRLEIELLFDRPQPE